MTCQQSCCKKATFHQGTNATGSNDWKEYVPVITNGTPASTTTILKGEYYTQGKLATLKFSFSQPDNTGASSSINPYIISFPAELMPILSFPNSGTLSGEALVINNSDIFMGVVIAVTSGFILIVSNDTQSPAAWGSAVGAFTNSGITEVQALLTLRIL